MSGYISFICVEECVFVHNSMARSRQSRSGALYLAAWTESGLAVRWPAVLFSTKDIFRACWLVVSKNSFKIRLYSLKSITFDPLKRRKSEIRYRKRGSARVRKWFSALVSGPRYMICVTLFARCATQKTHGHAFDKIWYATAYSALEFSLGVAVAWFSYLLRDWSVGMTIEH